MKRILLFTLLAVACSGYADDHTVPDAAFSAARSLYDTENYAAAAAKYDDILSEGWQTAEVYFNRGTALARLGKTGEAIASFETALLLNPRDADTLANLKFVRSNAGLPAPKQTLLDRALGYLAPREWRLLSIIAWWGFAAFLCVSRLLPGRAAWIRNGYIISLAILLIAFAGRVHNWQQVRAPAVVVTAKSAQALYAPLPDATRFFDTPEGSTLQLVEQTGDWLRVRSGAQVGWLPASACTIVRVAQ